MVKKFLLLDPSKFSGKTRAEILSLPLMNVLPLATYNFNNDELANYFNYGGDINNYLLYTYDAEDEIKMGDNDWYDLTVNNQLQIHIKTNDIGYSVDLYDINNINDGYISSALAYYEDFPEEEV